jgi:hypothetical protein
MAHNKPIGSTTTALAAYERHQAAIKKLLKKIEYGLLVHDRQASRDGGHNWAHVGDLAHWEDELRQVSDAMNHEGEAVK